MDKLEDELIDHPDASTRRDLLDTSLDETFQKKLHVRAEQIRSNQADSKRVRKDANGNKLPIQENFGGVNYQFLINKSHLVYDYKDLLSLEVEVGEWFTYGDVRSMVEDSGRGESKRGVPKRGVWDNDGKSGDKNTDLLENIESEEPVGNDTNARHTQDEDARHTSQTGKASIDTHTKQILLLAIRNPNSSSLHSSSVTKSLQTLLYFSFGEYETKESKLQQLDQIKLNNHILIGLDMLPALIESLETFYERQKRTDTGTDDKNGTSYGENISPNDHFSPKEYFSNYFKVLTLLYIAVNVILQSNISDDVLDVLESSDILANTIKFIEHWKWYPNNSYRVRYLILLCWKLILLEMGDTEHLKHCDDFLIEKHQILNKAGKDLPKNKLTCSPLDYFTFREDICDKYPLFSEPDLKVYNFEEFKRNLEDEDKSAEKVNKSTEEVNKYQDHIELNEKTNNSMNNESTDSFADNSSSGSSPSIDEKYNFFMAVNTYSNSLSNMIESPRTYKSHTVLSQLPTQTVHIATPVPSPTLTASDYMSGGEKIRRSYQVNQAMPLIYPNASENILTVPFAIEEADKILRSSIYESLSTKRLWNERLKFMKQERGYLNEYEKKENLKGYLKEPLEDIPVSRGPNVLSGSNEENLEKKSSQLSQEDIYLNIDEFDYDETIYDAEKNFKSTNPKVSSKPTSNTRSAARSILRVEKFYKSTLPHLHTFIQVLIETLKYNTLDYNLSYAELELNPETSYLNTTSLPNQAEVESKIRYVLMLQLEVIRVKEITLKASTSIILLLLKWFKASHVLKYYYLTSLLFDQQYFTISLEYLSRSFNNVNLQNEKKDKDEYEMMMNQNQLMNPAVVLPEFDFFNNCLKQFPQKYRYNLINKTFISTLPKTVDEQYVNHIDITSYNTNFCTILANILQTMNKILIKNITQRIFTINDLKLSELYKMILMNYDNEALTKPILKTLKKLIPYQGRKWKSTNMDLISQIYLNLKLSLKDNWLTGKDLESDINNSYDQEIALRALLQFYNLRRYKDEMERIGYGIEEIPTLNLDD